MTKDQVPLEFRAWDEKRKVMTKPFDIGHIVHNYNTEYGSAREDISEYNFDNRDQFPIFLQFTGLLDKNKEKIYKGDLVRIRFTCNPGQTYEYQVDAIYQADIGTPIELCFRMRKLESPDTMFDHLVLHVGSDIRTPGDIPTAYLCPQWNGGKHVRGGSEDWEIVGNIYENPGILQ